MPCLFWYATFRCRLWYAHVPQCIVMPEVIAMIVMISPVAYVRSYCGGQRSGQSIILNKSNQSIHSLSLLAFPIKKLKGLSYEALKVRIHTPNHFTLGNTSTTISTDRLLL